MGGVLTEYAGWEWGFLLNVPIGVVLLAITALKLVESRDPHPEPVVLIAGGLGIAALGTLISSTDYVGSLQTLFLVGGAIGGVGAIAALYLFRGSREGAATAVAEVTA